MPPRPLFRGTIHDSQLKLGTTYRKPYEMNWHIEIANPGERNLQVIGQLVDPFEPENPGGVVALTSDPQTDLARFTFRPDGDQGGNIHGSPFPSLLVREPACAEMLQGSVLDFLVRLKRRTPHHGVHVAH